MADRLMRRRRLLSDGRRPGRGGRRRTGSGGVSSPTDFRTLLGIQDIINQQNLMTQENRTLGQSFGQAFGAPTDLTPSIFKQVGQQKQQNFAKSQFKNLAGAGISALGSSGGLFDKVKKFNLIRTAQRSF